MSVNIQTDNGLKQIADKTTKKKIKEVLGYTPANEEDLNSHKEDDVRHISSSERDKWNNQPHITNDQDDTLLIIDKNGNVLAQFDSEGLHIIGVKIKGKDLLKLIEENGFSGDYYDLTNRPSIDETNDGTLSIIDEKGNIAVKIDQNGLDASNLTIKGEQVATETNVETTLEDYAKKEEIPTKMSELELDIEVGQDLPIEVNEDDKLLITDNGGNIITQIDKDGVHSTEFSEKGIFLKDKYAAKDSVPTKVSQLENDEDYTTIEDVSEVLVGPAIDECKEYTDNSVNSLNGDNLPIDDTDGAISIKEAVDSKLDNTEASNTYLKKEDAFSGDYEKLTNKPITTDDSDKELHITDNSGNIIDTIDLNGIHTTEFHEGGLSLKDKYLQLDDASSLTVAKADNIKVQASTTNSSTKYYLLSQSYISSSDGSGYTTPSLVGMGSVDTSVYYDPSVSTFGTNSRLVNITGNAATATKATQDGDGNVITTTYALKTELKNLTISATKVNVDFAGEELNTYLDDMDTRVIALEKGNYATKDELFSGSYDDLSNKPIETTDSDKELYITDKNGNILATFTAAGINAINFQEKSVNLEDKYALKDEIPTSLGDKRIFGVGKVFQAWAQSVLYSGGLSSSPVTSGQPTVNNLTSTEGRYYGIESDGDGRLFVNVPWVSGSSSSAAPTYYRHSIELYSQYSSKYRAYLTIYNKSSTALSYDDIYDFLNTCGNTTIQRLYSCTGTVGATSYVLIGVYLYGGSICLAYSNAGTIAYTSLPGIEANVNDTVSEVK